MYDSIFASPRELLMGAIAGFIFGFLLQKGGVTRYRVLMGQFLLKDWTVAKIMGTAIVVGGLGFYAMRLWGVEAPMHVKPAQVWGNLLGAVIFGVGMAVLGYCPGTSVGAMGDRSRHAIFGVFGMLVGAGLYAEAFPWFQERVLQPVDLGEITLPAVTQLPPLLWVLLVGVAFFTFFGVLEKRRRGRGTGSPRAGIS
jgi:uncharacterized protein